jgi:hypothetical protein
VGIPAPHPTPRSHSRGRVGACLPDAPTPLSGTSTSYPGPDIRVRFRRSAVFAVRMVPICR